MKKNILENQLVILQSLLELNEVSNKTKVKLKNQIVFTKKKIININVK